MIEDHQVAEPVEAAGVGHRPVVDRVDLAAFRRLDLDAGTSARRRGWAKTVPPLDRADHRPRQRPSKRTDRQRRRGPAAATP